MPRKSAFPPPETGHFSRPEISDLLTRESLDNEVAPRLVEHLSTHCPACWASVQAAAYDWQGPPTLDPALAALRRIAARDKAWMGLDGSHIEAIGDATREPLGFSFLVIEEALAMAAQSGFELDALTRALGLEDLFPQEEAMSEREVAAARKPPRADLFSQYLSAAALLSLAQDDLENVSRFMGLLNSPQRMEKLVIEESKLKILETSARCGREIGESELAYQDLARAYHEAGDRGFRQLDFSMQLAEVLTEGYREHAEELRNLIARTAEVCRILLSSKSTEIVLYIAFRLARFLFTVDVGLRHHLRTDDDPPPEGGPAGRTLYLTDVAPIDLVRTTYDFLDRAGSYFESRADLPTRTERHRYLFGFSLFVDPEGSLARARALQSALEQLGPDHWHDALATKGVIAGLQRREDPAAAAATAAEFYQELTSWLDPDEIDAFFDRIAAVHPAGDIRDLLSDDGEPPTVS